MIFNIDNVRNYRNKLNKLQMSDSINKSFFPYSTYEGFKTVDSTGVIDVTENFSHWFFGIQISLKPYELLLNILNFLRSFGFVLLYLKVDVAVSSSQI